MPDTTDLYETLGVAEDASAKEIKAAYRKLAQQYHPDRNAGDTAAEERFKEVQSAYDTLGDETKRTAYDRARRNPYGSFEGAPFGGGQPGGGRFYRAPDGTYVRADIPGLDDDPFAFGGGPGGGLGGIFDQFFGGAAGGGEPQYQGGRDIEASVRLSFEEALEGGPREFKTPTSDTVRVTVPKGVRDGFKIKLGGRGGASPNGHGAPGDLYLTFRVTPDARFSREGDNLVTTETISAIEAMLGTTREVTTAYGRTVRLKVKPGTQPGARLRVRGQGVETDAAKGDLYVVLEVEVPALEGETAQKLREWAESADLI